MSGYGEFARFYDGLMEDADYRRRAEVFLRLLEEQGGKPALVLDLACGTGSFSLELAKRGLEVIGADASGEMLGIAQEKARDSGQAILFLCQPMEQLDLYGTVDTVFCTLDSLNHLLTEEALRTVFARVALFLEPGGFFLFDVNTPYKHERVLGDNVFVRETGEVFCVWQNRIAERQMVEIQLDFFERRGEVYARTSETFRERAYSLPTLRGLLEEAGLAFVGAYGEWGEKEISVDAQRVICVAKSKK